MREISRMIAEPRAETSSALKIQLVFGPTGCTSGGLSVDVSSIANHLVERGHTVSVLTASEITGGNGKDQALPVSSGRPEQNQSYVRFADGVQLNRLRVLPFGDTAVRISVAPGAYKFIRDMQPDIVHIFSLAPNYLHTAAASAARLLNLPMVRSPMMYPNRIATWDGRGILGAGMRVFDLTAPRIVAKRANLIVAATPEEEEFFRSLGARRAVIAPPGVGSPEALSQEEILDFRRRFDLAGEVPVVLVVSARREPRKGFDLLQSTATELNNALPEAKILVVGTSDRSLTGENVIYTGLLDNRSLAQAYAAANVAFVPSVYEAFSRIVIEAWQQSCPVVVTNGVGLAGVVSKGAGLVVPVGNQRAATDALVEILTQPEFATHLGRTGRQLIAKDYAWPKIIDTLEDAYQQLHDEVILKAAKRRR